MEPDDFRVRSKQIWDSMAKGWEENRENFWKSTRSVGEWLVDSLSPQPGNTILELAAGPGDTGFAAAAIIGEEGRLISTDFAPAMLKVAEHRCAEIGLKNVDFKVMDAEDMDLADDSVDGVVCRWGYMLMADPLRAFKETRRVLRTGGKLSFACFTGPHENPWATLGSKVLVERGHMQLPQPGVPGIFALSETDRIGELLNAAGFLAPQFEIIPMHFHFDTSEDYWYFLIESAGAISPILKSLEDSERESVRAEIVSGAAKLQTDTGIDLPGVALGCVSC